MNISGAIRGLIVANSAANAVLSGRVYPVIFPDQYTLPAVAINLISTQPSNTKSGPSDLDIITMQVDTYGSTYTSAANTAQLVRSAIDYYRGDVLAGTVTVGIDGIAFQTCRDSFEEQPEEFRIIDEYSIRIKRSGGITDMPSFVGLVAYDNDGDALNAGVAYNEFYLLSEDNDYGMPYGVIKQVVLNPGTLGIYVSDAAAIVAGLDSGDYYVLAAANIYGLPHGTIKQVA